MRSPSSGARSQRVAAAIHTSYCTAQQWSDRPRIPTQGGSYPVAPGSPATYFQFWFRSGASSNFSLPARVTW